MPAQNLEQALEGIQFPCGRSQVVEYARHNQLGPRSLETLKTIPDREYRDLNELFSELPAPRHAIIATPLEPEDTAAASPMEAVFQLWLCGMQTWPEWVRLSQRLWFPWLR